MTKDEASAILETVLDYLIEMGNSNYAQAENMRAEATDKLFRFRDEYFKQIP